MRTCEICDKELLKRQKRFCSKECYGKFLKDTPEARNHFKPGAPAWNKGLRGYKAGSAHWNWKGGQRSHSNGYVEVQRPNHPCANSGGYILEHRLVMEKHLGRYLTQDEVVHHVNGDKRDNRIDNLVVLTRSDHQSMHTKEWWIYVNDLIRKDRGETNI